MKNLKQQWGVILTMATAFVFAGFLTANAASQNEEFYAEYHLPTPTGTVDREGYCGAMNAGDPGWNDAYYYVENGVLHAGGKAGTNAVYNDKIAANKKRTVTSAVFHEGITTITKTGLFYINSLTLPAGVETLDGDAFTGSRYLTEIELPASLRQIDTFAFRNCTELTEIKIPEGVEHLNIGTFYGCAKLKSITLPKSITSIDDNGEFYESQLFGKIPEDAVLYYEGSKTEWEDIKFRLQTQEGSTVYFYDATFEQVKQADPYWPEIHFKETESPVEGIRATELTVEGVKSADIHKDARTFYVEKDKLNGKTPKEWQLKFKHEDGEEGFGTVDVTDTDDNDTVFGIILYNFIEGRKLDSVYLIP